MTTSSKRRAKPAAKRPRRAEHAGRSDDGDRLMHQRMLDMLGDARQPANERVSLGISMLKVPQHAEAATRALNKLARGKIPANLVARIGKALVRHESKIPKREKAKRPEPPVDLSGPCNMKILMDADLYERWKEIHWNDPDQVWERTLGDVPQALLGRVPFDDREEMKRLPVEQRAARLDQLLAKALAK